MSGLLFLAASAAGVGVVHTLLGPDHYLPFIVLSRARKWTWARTAVITLACGGAHVLSSVVLAAVGLALGATVTRLMALESARGDLAAWGLVAVGAVYAAWGLRRAMRGDRHVHLNPQPLAHAHAHPHGEHTHPHEPAPADPVAAAAGHRHHGHHAAANDGTASPDGKTSLTPWMLFLVFVLGPCEPLIPLMMLAGAAGSIPGAALIAVTFGVATLLAMLAAVWIGQAGVRLLPLGRLEPYTHALAGAAILVSAWGSRSSAGDPAGARPQRG